MQEVISKVGNFISFDSIPVMGLTDYVEILIIAFLVYEVMVWIRDTRAWSLMRGIVVIIAFVLLAYLLQMTTILWLVRNGLNVLLMAVLIIFQPELRRALDYLGRKNFLGSLFTFNGTDVNERFSDKTMNEIIKACYEMGRARTGALIVMKKSDPLHLARSFSVSLASPSGGGVIRRSHGRRMTEGVSPYRYTFISAS